MVSQFPMDYMHLSLLGANHKLLHLWFKGPLRTRFFTPIHKQLISNYLIQLRKYIPTEFQRKPRGLLLFQKWKATEDRLFLLYIGVVVLKVSTLYSEDMEKLFTSLHVAIRLLCSYNSRSDADYAKQLLDYFVHSFKAMFGEEYVSPNIHGLYHLADEVIRMDTGLDSFSAFAFENFMRVIKAKIAKPAQPLEQISNRFSERALNPECLNVDQPEEDAMIVKKQQHFNGPLIALCGNPQYSQITFKGVTYSTSVPNNCCLIESDNVMIENFATDRMRKLRVIGRKYVHNNDLYTTPCKSSLLGIYESKVLSSKLYSWPVESIKNKYVRIPVPRKKSTFALIPLLHVK